MVIRGDVLDGHFGDDRQARRAVDDAHQRIERPRLEGVVRRHVALGLAQLNDLVTHTISGAQDHQVFQVDVLDADVLPFVQRVFGRNIGEKTVVEKFLFEDTVATRAAGDKCRVDPVALERLDDVRSDHLRDFQLHLRIIAHEIRDELVQQVGRNGRDDAQTQFTRSFALQFGDRLADIVVGPQRFPGAIQHHFAGLGRDHGFLRTVEQHDAQLLFERLHLHAQRRLGHETMLCGQRKTTAVRHRQEVFKLNYSHSSRLFQYTKI